MMDETKTEEIEMCGCESEPHTCGQEPEPAPRGRRKRGPNERWLLEKALELTAPNLQELLGAAPLDLAKLEALDRTKLEPTQIVILALWVTTFDILTLARSAPALKCGWCLRAAPDSETRAAVPELDGEAELIEHVTICQNNPLVRELTALKAQLA